MRNQLIYYATVMLVSIVSLALPVIGRLIEGVGFGGGIALLVGGFGFVAFTPINQRTLSVAAYVVWLLLYGFSALKGGL